VDAGLVVTVVRVGEGSVVLVVDGLVVAVVAVVADEGAVVAVEGAVVAVEGTAVDCVLVADPARSVSIAVMEFGLGTEAPEGTKATVMSWPSASLIVAGSWKTLGLFEPGGVKLGHTLIWSCPVFPASVDPAGHFLPLEYFASHGICSVLEVRVNLGYKATNRANVALLPASFLVVGATWTTPSPSVRIPGMGEVDVLGFDGRLGWNFPHT
jgi:hypothetical protein